MWFTLFIKIELHVLLGHEKKDARSYMTLMDEMSGSKSAEFFQSELTDDISKKSSRDFSDLVKLTDCLMFQNFVPRLK